MGETLKRYDIIADAVSGADVKVWSDQYPDGKWVKYKDAKAVIEAKDKRIEAALNLADEWDAPTDDYREERPTALECANQLREAIGEGWAQMEK